jgi:ribonuclease P protein component
MVSARHRFHGYGSLKYVYQHGQTTRGSLFAIKSTLNSRRQSYRVAVVVSRKVHKSAVTRNRIRRRLYEVFRLFEADIVEPYDIVLIVFSEEVATKPPDELQSQLEKQLKSAGLLVNRVVRQDQ